MTQTPTALSQLLDQPGVEHLISGAAPAGKLSYERLNEVLGDLDLDESGIELLLEALEERGIQVLPESRQLETPSVPAAATAGPVRTDVPREPRPPRKPSRHNDLDDVLNSLQEILGAPAEEVAEGEEGGEADDDLLVEDAFKQYLNRMGQVPRLTPGEERDLAEKARYGTPDQQVQAKQQLVEANLRLVVHLARPYAKSATLPVLDIVQEGNIGLMRAVDRYDPRRHQRLSAYATWWIRQSITRALTQQARSMRLPAHLYAAIEKLQRLQRQMAQQLGRTPSRPELAAASGMTVVQVDEALKASLQPISLEAPVGDKEISPLGERLHDPDAETPDSAFSRSAVHELLTEALQRLTDLERTIVMKRFGLREYDGRGPQTLDDVAAEMKLSPERVRQLEQRALRKLRRGARGAELEDLVDDSELD